MNQFDLIVILAAIAYGSLGWAGYWTEFQNRCKLEKQINRFYNGPEKEVECGTISKHQQIVQKIILKTREITGI